VGAVKKKARRDGLTSSSLTLERSEQRQGIIYNIEYRVTSSEQGTVRSGVRSPFPTLVFDIEMGCGEGPVTLWGVGSIEDPCLCN
jgi:hypothetical protein